MEVKAKSFTRSNCGKVTLQPGTKLAVEWSGEHCFSSLEYGKEVYFAKSGFTLVGASLPLDAYLAKVSTVATNKHGVKLSLSLTPNKAESSLDGLSVTELQALGYLVATSSTPYPQQLGRALRVKPNLNQEVNTMNTGAELFAAVSNDFTTIECKFRDSNQKVYTYKAKLADGVMVGDAVVVFTPSSGFTVVDVVAVHDVPTFNYGINYKWIVQRVDATAYRAQEAVEKELSDAAVQEARTAERKSTLKAIRKAFPEGSAVRSILEKYMV